MAEYLIGIDTDLFLWLNSHHSPFWDTFMYAASGRAIWIPLYVAILYAIYLCYGWRTTILMAFISGVAIGISDQVCAEVLRPAIERMRPANPENPLSESVHVVFDYRGGRYGFPSSHAANTFALAALTSLLFRRWQFTLFSYLWALIICYSRIYLGVHYPGDILAGLLIGSFFGAVGYLLPKALIERLMVYTPVVTSRIGSRTVSWHPCYLPVIIGILTFICILAYSLI